MQNCLLCIFDVIVAINAKLVKDYSSEQSPQDILKDLLYAVDFVSLRIYRPYYALKTTAKVIASKKIDKSVG